MNLLLFPAAEHAEYHHIVRLPELISESEHAQMEAKLPELVASAKVYIALSFKPDDYRKMRMS